jgi:ligand-binding sensor domain-containing protein
LRTRIPFMTFDNKDNLWICNFGASRPLVVWSKDGTWQNFSVPGNNNLSKIAIDKNQNKWISVQGVGNGLLVFNEGKDFVNTSDDKVRYITSANSEIKANRVHTVFADLNGSVWVGTSEGPVIFDCPDPFNNNCTGATRKVIEDGIPAILLKTEEILSIAADGANRKWLGTRNGIFVLSPSGDTLITKYDSRNSPLLDNVVRYLSFNGESGEMWISTNNGLQSFRTTTTFGGKVHKDVYVFPNPVRPEYSGPVAINGLVRDANVKITDMNGRLVYETTAEGGQAIWYAKDYDGNRVASGVYLVFSSGQEIVDKPETLVTKILVMN